VPVYVATAAGTEKADSGIKPADIPRIVPVRIGRFDMAPFDCRDDD
jgi:hypothetical protein